MQNVVCVNFVLIQLKSSNFNHEGEQIHHMFHDWGSNIRPNVKRNYKNIIYIHESNHMFVRFIWF